MSVVVSRLQESLGEIASSETVPRNVRAHATRVLDILSNDSESLSSKKDKIIQVVEQMVDDPNIGMAIRVDLYNAVSFVEQLDREVL